MTWQEQVNQLAASLGIPASINQAVQSVESNGNPNAVGDQGTSFGLYQLHIGGQAPSGVPTSRLLDPLYNAQIALPHIASGYQAAGPFADTSAWWTKFAVLSGHPGGSTSNSDTIAEAAKLRAAYEGGSPFSQSVTTVSTSSSDSNSIAGLSSFIQDRGIELLFLIVVVTIVGVAIVIIK